MEVAWRAVDEHVTGAYSLMQKAWGVQLTSTPPTQGLLWVDSPTPIVVAVILYVACVLAGLLWIRTFDLKPRVKEPTLLQGVVLVHNLFCFGISLYICVGVIYQAVIHNYTLWGNPYVPEQNQMAFLIYLFYMSKYVEFMDTGMALVETQREFVFCAAYFSAALNSGVHVFMYMYYLLSAVFRSDEKLRRKYLFWGKYLTQLQMLQFLLNMVQAYYDRRVDAPYPPFLTTILFYYMITLLLLFAHFYVHKYAMSSQGKRKGAKTD